MTDRPILFSAPMIRALLDGRKTQTRRILKLPTKGQYIHPQKGGWEATTVGGGAAFTIERDGTRKPAPEMAAIWHRTTGKTITTRWQKGDRLWVRETAWYDASVCGGLSGLRCFFEGRLVRHQGGTEGQSPFENSAEVLGIEDCHIMKRPGIHMPRWASRLTLTVTDVRVQRLQEISPQDAIAEGIESISDNAGNGPAYRDYLLRKDERSEWYADPVNSYCSLWGLINGAASWPANPWVVALTFTVERRNIDHRVAA